MLENDHFNLQTKFGMHIIWSISPNLKLRDRTTPPPYLPPLKALPSPEKVQLSKCFR